MILYDERFGRNLRMARNQTKALATAAAREKNSRDKAYIILRDLIFKMHSKFKNLPDAVKEDFLENPEFFNVEKLVEFTAAEVGGFERTDLHYSDLSDGTEVKTASVQLKPSSNKSVNSFQGKVTNVGHVSSGRQQRAREIFRCQGEKHVENAFSCL